MKHILPCSDQSSESVSVSEPRSRQWLLASETGSGKSIAYLLPLLQSLKLSELNSSLTPRALAEGGKELNPRALVLAPTHELARQLSIFAKALQHEIKLRIMCASRANTTSSGQEKQPGSHARERGIRASEMSIDISQSETGEFDLTRKSRPVDVLVGTPMKLLEMVRGRGWEKDEDGPGSVLVPNEAEDEKRRLRRGRDKIPGAFNKARSEGVMALKSVEWVIVDEADVLFDPDFQETTRMLLSDISAAKGPSSSSSAESSPDNSTTYPFNLIFTSATIPTSLHNYITQNHPDMQRLISPGVHKLPKDLKVEYINWTGGNRMADVEKRIRQVWAEDYLNIPKGDLSQVVIFCNKSNKVRSLGEYLESKRIKNVSVTSTSGARARGSNRHLSGFLRTLPEKGPENEEADKREVIWDNEEVAASTSSDLVLSGPRALKPTTTSVTSSSTPLSPSEENPLVLITTSLLSRGLDFSPSIKHVFIIDEPRNVLDFLHRAGRSGRAGHKGRVVVFGKFPESGRGAGRGREVKKRVGDLVSRRRR
ncbi:P-loop containing nucleoside triphosphate hydrolase protein [Marasmius fiardii PR-910]|nr:P-loop containing nucleoside triphosphate hydrolase protein [Marasmius fiardii PR-910]